MARTATLFADLAPSLPARPRGSLIARLVAATALGRSRRCLMSLDERMLRDVGLTRAEAVRESRRPAWDALDERPWDAPAHWLR